MIKVGFHVSIAGGISNSVDNAKKVGCSAFQIFSRNPRGWTAKPLASNDVEAFNSKFSSSGITRDSVVVHMPYLPNLSGPDGDFYTKSVETLAGEIQRCSLLGIPFLVIHLGSHLGKGTSAGIDQLVKSCNIALEKYKKSEAKSTGSPVTILLENNAGQKNSIGSKFEEIGMILDKLKSKEFGVCLDTCHAFASGHDIRTHEGVNRMLEQFDGVIELKNLKIIHLNDSKGDLNSNLDRHYHIGLGKIGKEGFKALLARKEILSLPMIMETPIDSVRNDEANMKALMDLINWK